jgi:ketosteroid isomerase-like protein
MRARVTDMYAAVDACDWATVRSYYSDDCVYERPGIPALEGIEAIMNFYERLRPVQKGRHSLNHVFQEGNRICVTGEFEGVMRGGTQAKFQFADLFISAGNRIRYRQSFFYTPVA